MFRTVDLITKKRDGQKLTKEELAFLINGYVHNEIPDYQISALLMAIYFVGLDFEEMTALTDVMVHSGDMVDLSPIKGVKVDKHSTGGVGDKTSLVVGPICAAGGVKIAKMSGRGLGHTGGTLDKLESIPGYQIELDSQAFFRQVNDIGLSIIGQSANITPADKKLYALRDVTGTIESIGLIAASIMSKKLASGADYIVLDVKVGSGAFMKDVESAKRLAEAMVAIGKASGRETVATLTDMEQPLGFAIGNTLEVIEAIETLKGRGPKDFAELCYNLSAEVFLISGIASTMEEALALVDEVISSGKALEKFRQMVERQGGNPKVVEDYSLMPLATHTVDLYYQENQEAYVEHIDALKIGEAAMILGAGRAKKEDVINHGVGIVIHKKVGDKVKYHEKIATLYTSGEHIDEALALTHDAYRFSNEKVAPRPIIITSIR